MHNTPVGLPLGLQVKHTLLRTVRRIPIAASAYRKDRYGYVFDKPCSLPQLVPLPRHYPLSILDEIELSGATLPSIKAPSDPWTYIEYNARLENGKIPQQRTHERIQW